MPLPVHFHYCVSFVSTLKLFAGHLLPLVHRVSIKFALKYIKTPFSLLYMYICFELAKISIVFAPVYALSLVSAPYMPLAGNVLYWICLVYVPQSSFMPLMCL